MGALKPWHILTLLCCLIVIVSGVGCLVWVGRRADRKRRQAATAGRRRSVHSGPATVLFGAGGVDVIADIWVDALGPLHGWGGRLYGRDLGPLWDAITAREPMFIQFGAMCGRCMVNKAKGTTAEFVADIVGAGPIDGPSAG